MKGAPFIPDEQTLLIVVQITEVGMPAPKAACLAGAWPKFALRTIFPKKTYCTSERRINICPLKSTFKLIIYKQNVNKTHTHTHEQSY
jgi:hypothetical protein